MVAHMIKFTTQARLVSLVVTMEFCSNGHCQLEQLAGLQILVTAQFVQLPTHSRSFTMATPPALYCELAKDQVYVTASMNTVDSTLLQTTYSNRQLGD